MKIGVFGGTFNPIHYAHLRACEEITGTFLDKIIFIPSGITSNKSESVVCPEKRLEMVKIATKDNPKFEVSDIEITRGGVSFSYDTVKELSIAYSDDELFFIIGADAFFDIKTWKNFESLFSMINFLVMNRNNYININDNEKIIPKILLNLSNRLPDKIREGIKIDHLNNRLITLNNRSIYFFKVTRMDISSTDIRNNFKLNRSNSYLLPKELIDYIIYNKLYL